MNLKLRNAIRKQGFELDDVKKDFGLPPEQHKKPISGDVLSRFKLKHSAIPRDLGLGLVVVEACNLDEGRTWSLTARSGHIDDKPRYMAGDESVRFGAIELSSNTAIAVEPAAVLSAAGEWIRYSENTEWVPGQIQALPVGADMAAGGIAAAGLLLVRARNNR